MPIATPAGDDLVVTRGLKKYFPVRGGVTGRTVGFVRAVDGVDLNIARGRTLGLIGESGCGKTTVGRCILRLLEPTAGTVHFDGRDMARIPRPKALTLAGGLLVCASVVNILILLVAILSQNVGKTYALPDVFVLLSGVLAPGSTGGVIDLFRALGPFWIPLTLVGIFASALAAGAAFEAYRPFPAMAGAAVVLLTGQFVLGGAALALIGLSWRHFGKDSARGMRKDMQIVFQDPFGSLNPRMLVSRTITEPLRSFRDEVAQRYPELGEAHGGRLSEASMAKVAVDLIARVGLNPEHLNRFPHEFSGGQRQRICVARALALKPAFIVLDEPTSALDVSVQAQILNLMKEIQKERSLTYLFISHHLAVIRHMCDEIAVMYLGKIVEKAKNEALFEAPMHPYTIALLSAIPSVDPETRRERIVLEGEIPSPANPPSGCHFHTRCNFAVERETLEVDAEWSEDEAAAVVLKDPLAAPNTVRLVVAGAVVDPLASLGTVAYEVVELESVGVEVRVKSKVEPRAPARVRYRRYRESCATVEPPLAPVAPDHLAACHYSSEALEAHARAKGEGRPIGVVVAEMRAPLAPSAAAKATPAAPPAAV